MLIDKVVNNTAKICKRLYALIITKELGFYSGSSNDKDVTYDKINSIMENDVIDEHKGYLSNHYGIKLNSKIEGLPLMYCIPNMHKNPVRSRFIIASPKCTLKPLSKNITALFKVFYKKIEKHNSKNRILVWGRFWLSKITSQFLIQSINLILSRCQLLIFLPYTPQYLMISFWQY